MTARYMGLLCFFILVMLSYTVILGVQQIRGGATRTEKGDVVETRQVTVSSLRGEIYDKNGVLLVGNSKSYDLIFEYGSIPYTTNEFNESLLQALAALEATDNLDKLCDDYYPFVGKYPALSYSEAAMDESSEEHKYLLRVLEANSLDKDTSAEAFCERLIKKYKLSKYKDAHIDVLLRVRYSMERIKFSAYTPYTFAADVGIELVSYVKEAGIDGANFTVSSERYYAYPGYASHVLGRVGKIRAGDVEYYSELGYPMDAYVGVEGCELAFESYLRGQDGVMEIGYDADGNIVSKEFIKEPIAGYDVYLTIDIELQIAAEDSLKSTVEAIGSSDSGAIVSLDANTGAVRVMASYPTYDLSQFSETAYYNSLLADPARPLLDRTLSEHYAPGSIYKLGSALAALEQTNLSNISASTHLYCAREFYPGGPTCLGYHGSLDIIHAIGVSCNCFFYELGDRMGIDSINPYTSALGLGKSTGIELPEVSGIIAGSAYRENNKLDPWDGGDDLSAVIGQSDHAYTPLQLSVFMMSISNGGSRYAAHLLDSVREFYTGEIIYEYQPQLLEEVNFSASTYSTLVSGMRQVISSSSSLTSYFTGLGVEVGGKTGTAEVSGKYDYALFGGVAPLNDPELVSVCVLEQGVNGANAAIPVSALFKAYFNTPVG